MLTDPFYERVWFTIGVVHQPGEGEEQVIEHDP